MRRAAFTSSGVAVTSPMTFFWFGQMMNHTLNHMIKPSHMPKPISVKCRSCWPMPRLSAWPIKPSSQARIRPKISVNMAPQRNQNSASGRM